MKNFFLLNKFKYPCLNIKKTLPVNNRCFPASKRRKELGFLVS